MIRCDLVLLKCLICGRDDHSCLVVIDCFDFFRRGAGSGCMVIGVKSAEGAKERGKKGDIFSSSGRRDYFFSLLMFPGAAEAERFISSAELAVIVGNQPLKLF